MVKYFGTDGIRGPANGTVLRPDVLVRIGQAVGQVVAERMARQAQGGHAPTVVIGKDTRLSGYMIESALQSGFNSVGFTTLLLGPLPTPAVSLLTRSLRADVGVMITASHNPYEDNGIKLFGADGVKLNGEYVAAIEALIDAPEGIRHAAPAQVGRALRVEDAVGRYMEYIKLTVPRAFNLHGMKIVVDCAHGAAYKIAPRICWELGAQVFRMGAEPDGTNINRNVGATSPEALAKAVLLHNADIGIALDGDGDRLIIVDETGKAVDGDCIIAAMAAYLHKQGRLQGGGVVSTVMSNMGFERYVQSLGLNLIRTPVGDHHVEAAMREGGYNLGGEQSGHLIFRDYMTTGDGLLAALQVLAYLREEGRKASTLSSLYQPWPQTLENIRLPEGSDAKIVLESDKVQSAIAQAEKALGQKGRVLVRKSGTEPLIRVMVEAEAEADVAREVAAIGGAVRAVV